MSDAGVENEGTAGRTVDVASEGSELEIAAVCEAIVEDYRNGETRKAKATAQLYRALRFVLLGPSASALCSTSTLTVSKSFKRTTIKSRVSLLPSPNSKPSASSILTAPSEEKLGDPTPSSCPPSRNSTASIPYTSSEREQELKDLLLRRSLLRRILCTDRPPPANPACVSMSVDAPLGHADITTSALPAREGTWPRAHKRQLQETYPIVANKRPRRFHGFLWDDPDLYVTPLTTLSESMSPLPSPQASDLRDDVPRSTLTVHSHLFSIITPAKVDVLEC
ncbi:hypothetical protein NUW54_g4778 [Trametes sanguinea]|uniref:Uncharacterized protein n=1 Tax=Trametes sanguinea TaxID=158606 RepID=A0ACC1PY87_9APHY|nr:hypothetical protein NUW54_g4778 [Trametes sanguinea]